jgi:hypothetical protein
MASGWLSVVGDGDSACNFMWVESFTGDGYSHLWNTDTIFHQPGDRAFCLNGCLPPDSMTLLAEGGNSFTIDFWAPVTATYNFYYSASMTSIFPAGFTQFYSNDYTFGRHSVGMTATIDYARFVMTTDCGGDAAFRSASSPIHVLEEKSK